MSMYGMPAMEHTSVPRTTPARQQASLDAHSLERDQGLSETLLQWPWDVDVEKKGGGGGMHEETVLYLAYGSNMDTRTFSKVRGIKPVSLVNVFVPELELTFDLAALPYKEPCYATTRYRRVDRGPGDKDREDEQESDDEKGTLLEYDRRGDPRGHWNKPLVGVVYEITARDYAWMIAMESGGRGYNERVVTCYPFPDSYDPADEVPDHPTTRPFKAHSLLSLLADNDDDQHRPSPIPFNPRIRPNPSYAQPSRRYRDLVHSGAVESGLPFAYRDYLLQVHAYEATTARQRTGKAIFLALWFPLILLLQYLTVKYARPDGYSPTWVAVISSTIYTCMWKSYDWFFFRAFGDGERTIGDPYR